MNILSIIQEFCKRTGIRQPSAAMTSNDAQVLQLVALANEILDDLMMNHARFSQQVIIKTWTSTGAEVQGSRDTLFPGFLWFMPKSFYDRTAVINIRGPLTPEEWERLKALSAYSSVYPSYRFIGTDLHLYPVVLNTHTLAVEYKSEYCVLDATNTAKKYFTVDTDTPTINSTIILLGLRYLWKKEKGMDYLPAQDMYIKAVRSLGSQDGQKTQIDMGAEANRVKPGIYIPDSNWPVG